MSTPALSLSLSTLEPLQHKIQISAAINWKRMLVEFENDITSFPPQYSHEMFPCYKICPSSPKNLSRGNQVCLMQVRSPHKVSVSYRVNPQGGAMQLITIHSRHVYIQNSATVNWIQRRSAGLKSFWKSPTTLWKKWELDWVWSWRAKAAQWGGNQHPYGLRKIGVNN